MVRRARIKITIGGTLRPYTDGHWVVFTPSGWPTGFMHLEPRHLKPQGEEGRWVREPFPEKAFTDFFQGGPVSPLQAAMDGYTIKLVPEEELDELMRQHLGKDAESKERQHGDTSSSS